MRSWRERQAARRRARKERAWLEDPMTVLMLSVLRDAALYSRWKGGG
jgi:hypothetical protein